MLNSTAEPTQWIRLDKTSRASFECERTAEAKMATPPPEARTDQPLFVIDPQPFGPQPPGAQWLGAVQQKIAASTIPPGYEQAESGNWLSQEVATAALAFIAKASNEFTVAPYLYGSPSGDLAAEFVDSKSRSTFIISPDSVTAFAVVEGKPILKNRPLRYWSTNQLRIWRDRIQAPLSGKRNGPIS
jgi:hypothetical protein